MAAVSAVLVPTDPEQPITRITVDGLDDLQAAVGGDIEAVDTGILGHRLTSYINAEGKYNGCQPNPRATQLLGPALFAGDWIAGPLLVCGFDADTGENRDCPGGFEHEFLGVPRRFAQPDHRLRGERRLTYAWELGDAGENRRHLAVLSVGYSLGVHQYWAAIQNEIAASPVERILCRGLTVAGGIVLCRETVPKFSHGGLQRFADVALARLGGLYGESDPTVTRYFKTWHGGSLGAVL